jgi:hypothetical protein
MSTQPPMADPSPGIEPSSFTVNTINEYMIVGGENLGNHSTSLAGRSKFVQCGQMTPIIFRTKQAVFRFCAWVQLQAEMQNLPDEPGEHTYEEVLEAIKNT